MNIVNQGNKSVDIVIPVYNDVPYLEAMLNSIFKQKLPAYWSVKIYIVDDGSDTPISLQMVKENVFVVRVTQNKGRGNACNVGANTGVGDYIYILDSDCVLQNKNILASHIQTLSEDLVSVSCGQIFRKGTSFWAEYQTEVFLNRARLFTRGDRAALTTANFMLTREAYESIDGFDSNFTYYGFEDKDFLLRLLAKKHEIRFSKAADVEHMSDLSLKSIYSKIKQAGLFSSEIFIRKHPEYYRKMRYFRADARFSGNGLRIIALLTKPIVFPLISASDWLLNKGFIPYIVAKKIVSLVSGLAYLHGTYELINSTSIKP